MRPVELAPYLTQRLPQTNLDELPFDDGVRPRGGQNVVPAGSEQRKRRGRSPDRTMPERRAHCWM